MRKQYHFRPSPNGYYAWDVDKLIEKSGMLTVQSILVAQIAELHENYWFQHAESSPTCHELIEHMRLIESTDLQYPIILCAEGRVMDGMHRVAKAHLLGDQHISAVQFDQTPEPDFTDVHPDQLDYS